MSGHSRSERLRSFLISVLTVAAAIIYICFGDRIAEHLESFTEIGYSELVSLFGGVTEGELEVHIIDVGQADSTLIRSTDGVILIDAGSVDSVADLKAYLDACKIDTIDYFICTHPHSDHIGGASMVLKNYDVKNVLITDLLAKDVPFQKLMRSIAFGKVDARIPRIGDSFTLGDIEFTVLGPLYTYDDGNDMSLIIRLTYGETVFLFTGDAGSEPEHDLLERYTEKELDCDFYKIAHHGANTASSEEFLKVITPEIAVASSGKNNPYTHPRGEVLARLSDVGCETVLRTDLMGTVVISSDGKMLRVKAQQNRYFYTSPNFTVPIDIEKISRYNNIIRYKSA